MLSLYLVILDTFILLYSPLFLKNMAVKEFLSTAVQSKVIAVNCPFGVMATNIEIAQLVILQR
jgi:hypothetical protein